MNLQDICVSYSDPVREPCCNGWAQLHQRGLFYASISYSDEHTPELQLGTPTICGVSERAVRFCPYCGAEKKEPMRTKKQRYEIQRIEIPGGGIDHRITETSTDSRVATSYHPDNAQLVCDALNAYAERPSDRMEQVIAAAVSRSHCIPRAPLCCWQYRTGSSDPIPRWAAPWLLMQPRGRLEFVWPDNGGQQELADGYWLVLLEDGTHSEAWCEAWCAWYTDDEFRSQYEVVTR